VSCSGFEENLMLLAIDVGNTNIVFGVFDGAIGVLCRMPNSSHSADERDAKMSRRIARSSVLPRA